MTTRGPTGVYWGELVGGPDGFSLTRATGWEPGVATIQVTRAHVLDWALKHDPKRFEDLEFDGVGFAPAVAALLNAAVPTTLKAIPSLPYRADLCVSEVVDGRVVDRVFRDMFLVEARVADARALPDVLELTLADARRWWRDYGVLDRLEANLIQGTEGGAELYVARSLRTESLPEGAPWKLREVLQACLDRLPGQPEIVEWPGSLKDRLCQPVQAFGASPLEVARQLAANARLVFEFGFDGTCGFHLRGSGVIGAMPESGVGGKNTRPHDPTTNVGVWKDLVPQATNLFSLRVGIDAPDEVVVELPPPIWTVIVDYLDPVLPVDEPDPAGGPPMRAYLPLDGETLNKLAKDARKKSGGQVEGPDGVLAPDTRAVILLRAPLFSEAWPESLASVPDRVRDLMAGRNWRWWRLPYRMEERYAPILPRAEVGSDGQRLPVLVQAWGWRPMKAIVLQEEDIGGLADQRSLDEKKLVLVTGELARLREQIDKIDSIKAVDIQQAWSQIMAEIPDFRLVDAAWRAELAVAGIDVTSTVGQAALFVAEGATRAAVALEAAKRSEALKRILEKLAREAPKALAIILQIPNADLLDPALRPLPVLQASEKDLIAQRNALVLAINPTATLEAELGVAVSALTALMATAGADTVAKVAEIEALRVRILAAREDFKRREKRPVEVTMHVNLPRRPVEATWHPGRVVELADPSGWLANPVVSDPAETFMLPLPPCVTFGSYNLPAPQQTAGGIRPGKVSENAFVQAGVDVLKASEPAFARDLAHVVPESTSTGPVRLTFTRADKKSGKATVGPHPFRITRDGQDWQVLYPLARPDGDTVLGVPQPIIDKAAELADAAMTEQVIPSGEFTVLGAHYVLGNGAITAVRWVSVGGHVDTTIFFNSGAEPVPGLELEEDTESPEPLVFGFPLELGEGAA